MYYVYSWWTTIHQEHYNYILTREAMVHDAQMMSKEANKDCRAAAYAEKKYKQKLCFFLIDFMLEHRHAWILLNAKVSSLH